MAYRNEKNSWLWKAVATILAKSAKNGVVLETTSNVPI